MQTGLNKRIAAIACIIIASAIGIAIGFSIKNHTAVFTGYEKITVNGLKEAISAAPAICSSQMIQMLIIYVSGMTFLSHPVCITILVYRTALLSYSALSVVPSLSAGTVLPLISYFIITVFCVYLSYRSMTMSKGFTSAKNSLSIILSHTYAFLIVSGASIFMKILPMFIFRK